MRLLIQFQALLLLGLALTSPASAWAQAAGQRDEQAIRELAERVSLRSPADEQQVRQVYANDAVFVSGAYPRPRIGRDTSVQPVKEVQAEKRANQKLTETIRRLEVSKSGDMAWEFTDFRLSYEATSTGKRVEFPGSMLRVWQKIDERWRIVA